MTNMTENIQTITAEDHARISLTIKNVEQNTSGEIYAVVARESDDYLFVAGFMAAFWALLIGVVLALISWFWNLEIGVVLLAAAQLASFAASMAIFKAFPATKLWFVPRSVAYKRASNNAVRQFLAHGIHTTSDRSGVLIFVSLAEHYVEIVADAGINEKVDQSEWDKFVSILTSSAAAGNLGDGFVAVIEKSGKLLAEHFPPIEGQMSELDDRLVEI